MRNFTGFLFLFIILGLQEAFSSAKVTQVSWTSSGPKSQLDLQYTGAMNDAPDWTISGTTFTLFLPKAKIEKTINKTLTGAVHLKTENTKDGAIIVGTFPNDYKLTSENTSLNVSNGRIQVLAPKVRKQELDVPTEVAVAAPVIKEEIVKTSTVMKEDLNEEYLAHIENDLLDKKPEIKKTENVKNLEKVEFNPQKSSDQVKLTQSSLKKETNNFSFVTYAGKFVAFLGIVLLFFWGVVQLMKKGFLSKGKLSFLNGQQLVSVLSTTYISPKRSLLLVKVSQQVFLIAQSESGMQLVSEVHNVPGIIKETEKVFTGTNFDQDLNSEEDRTSQTLNTSVVLKENIFESKELPTDSVKDITKFSRELKKKVRGLKPLQ